MKSDTSVFALKARFICGWILGLILKRAICLFHGTLSLLSESPWSGFAALDKKMPVIVSLEFFGVSSQPTGPHHEDAYRHLTADCHHRRMSWAPTHRTGSPAPTDHRQQGPLRFA